MDTIIQAAASTTVAEIIATLGFVVIAIALFKDRFRKAPALYLAIYGAIGISFAAINRLLINQLPAIYAQCFDIEGSMTCSDITLEFMQFFYEYGWLSGLGALMLAFLIKLSWRLCQSYRRLRS